MTFATRFTKIATGVILLALSGATVATAQQAKNVVELFTSQGCSSCPKADALFKTFANRKDLVALSYNVDYWDYLGWKDTLGKPEFTKRQRAYALARGDGKVYTPQIVTNGLDHAVGSDKPNVEHALRKTADKLSGQRPTLELDSDDASFIITVGAGVKQARPATIFVAAVTPAITVKIKGGENDNRSITYHNVVRDMMPVGMWSGEKTTIRMRRQDVLASPNQNCAVLVQADGNGAILAADWMPQ